jgi:hypothetical protein
MSRLEAWGGGRGRVDIEDECERRGAIRAEAGEGRVTRPAGTYRAYLLRLWHTAEGQWRATLEDAHSGERRAFARVEELARFLEGGPLWGTPSGDEGRTTKDEGHLRETEGDG